jgi:tryptophan synthase alpha chain
MTRIAHTFAGLRSARRTGLVTYVTAGDPSLAHTGAILRELDRAGADILEVGVPFSDPVADGPVIQRACERALAVGTTLPGVLAVVQDARPSITAPIVLFSYLNPVVRMGAERFIEGAAAAGVDGVLLLDAPVEEMQDLREGLRARAIDPIFLVSPSTTTHRLERIARAASGFIYAVSRAGVTGARADIPAEARELVVRIRAVSDLPVALGFGISTPGHIREVGGWADAAVVGSALVERIAAAGSSPALLPAVGQFVRSLRDTEEVMA